MKVIAVAGVKGGVGKTSTAVNLAHIAARNGVMTLLWDLDPQGAATHCYESTALARSGVSGGSAAGRSRRSALRNHIRRVDAALDLLPVGPRGEVVGLPVGGKRPPAKAMRRAIASLGESYELVILDCPPGLGPVTEAVVEVSDLVLSPVVPAPLSVRTLDQFADFVEARRPGLPIVAFLSMLDERKVLHRQMVETLSLDARFCGVAIPVSSSVERMGMEQRPAVVASPRNLAARAYASLWEALAGRLGLGPGPG